MEKKELPTEYFPESYRTGDVQPPKSYRGLITLLLLLVIFLGSLVSALSFANIHLFRLLQNEEDPSVRFISDMRLSAQAPNPTGSVEVSGLEVEGCFLTEFDRNYFELPQGIYITQAAASSGGLQAGDILLRINGTTVTDPDTLQSLLCGHDTGTILFLDIYREGAQQTLTVIIDNPN